MRIAAYSADGEIRFGFQCPICNENFVWQMFASALQHTALISDLDTRQTNKKLNRAVNNEISRIVRPPLNALTVNDLKELHEMHILDDTEEAK